MARPRYRARLTGGGPTWENRPPKQRIAPPAAAVPEADALMALDGALVGLQKALQQGDLRRAREMRREAWRYVDLLPPGRTWRQRRTLGRYKVRIREAEEKARRSGPAA